MSVRDVPFAIESEFFAGLTEEPVQLYCGPGTITENGITYDVGAVVSLRLRPSPRLSFEATSERLPYGGFVEPSSLRLEESQNELSTSVTRSNVGLRAGSIQNCVVHPNDGSVRYALFGVPNLGEFFGDIARYACGTLSRSRITLRADEWTVTLDGVLPRVLQKLEEEGGVATTHVARLERTDGREFSAKDVQDILRGLEIYLSFVAAATIGISVVHGFDEAGARVWEIWKPAKIRAFRNRQSWADRQTAETAELGFSEFMRLWRIPHWRRTLSNAIQWYVEAHRQAGYLEGSIIFLQSVIELLVHTTLIEDPSFIGSSKEMKNAAGRLRLLVASLALPKEIPSQLTRLIDWQCQESLADGPENFTKIRHDLVHPERDNRERLERMTGGVYFEAWKYGLWIAELAILKKLGYRGQYGNRITQVRQGQVELVPWA